MLTHTNAQEFMDSITQMAVEKVAKANEGKHLTESQWTQAVENVILVALPKTLDQIAESDPAAAKRISHELMNGLE